MTQKAPTIVVDADAIVAQAHPQDTNHNKSLQIAQKLKDINAQMIYPITAVYEAVTVLQHKLSSTATAYGTAVVFTDLNLQVTDINQTIMTQAIHDFFKPDTSKKNTLFDCTILAVAEAHKADAIFSFDHFYKNKGFKLAEELEIDVSRQ